MSIVVNNMANRGQLRISGMRLGKSGFSEANIHCTNFVGFAAEEAPATSLYGYVTNVGGAIFGAYFDVEFGAGGVNGCGKIHL